MSNLKDSSNDQGFVSQIRETLDASVEQMDADTCHKIIMSRKLALAQHKEKSSSMLGWSKPAFAIAITVLVALVIVKLQLPNTMEQENIEAIELIVSQDTLDLYEDLDFYAWLADEDVAT